MGHVFLGAFAGPQSVDAHARPSASVDLLATNQKAPPPPSPPVARGTNILARPAALKAASTPARVMALKDPRVPPPGVPAAPKTDVVTQADQDRAVRDRRALPNAQDEEDRKARAAREIANEAKARAQKQAERDAQAEKERAQAAAERKQAERDRRAQEQRDRLQRDADEQAERDRQRREDEAQAERDQRERDDQERRDRERAEQRERDRLEREAQAERDRTQREAKRKRSSQATYSDPAPSESYPRETGQSEYADTAAPAEGGGSGILIAGAAAIFALGLLALSRKQKPALAGVHHPRRKQRR